MTLCPLRVLISNLTDIDEVITVEGGAYYFAAMKYPSVFAVKNRKSLNYSFFVITIKDVDKFQMLRDSLNL